ncbi:MAG TPA: hypothetical protein VFE07_08115 [Marmoricola sp.]|nr:hypothetical protein [Marmoricola sp.]
MSLLKPSRFLRPALAAAVLSLLAGVLAGCGGSSAGPDEGALGSTANPTPTTPATTPTRAVTRKPRPTKAVTTADQGGDGDAEGDNEPASKGGGICRFVGAEEVGGVLGTAVQGAAVPDVTGCKFDSAGHSLSVTIIDKSAAQAGGMDGAKSEATSAVEGDPQDLSGIGSGAFVVTGTMFGGPDVNAAGAVKLGNRIISVFLVQTRHLGAAKVRSLEVDLLKLVAREGS